MMFMPTASSVALVAAESRTLGLRRGMMPEFHGRPAVTTAAASNDSRTRLRRGDGGLFRATE